jgi:hypothetical protein
MLLGLLFAFGSVGEKDNEWRTRYFFGALILGALIVIFNLKIGKL